MLKIDHVLLISALYLLIAGSAYAGSKENLAEESMNPLSTVISVPFENNTLFGTGPAKSTVNILNVKPIFPVNIGKWNLINRLTIPILYTEGQDKDISGNLPPGMGNPGSFGFGKASGLADVTYQGFITPANKSGKLAWGLGGSLVIPTHTEPRFGADKWSAGPAVVIFTSTGNWILGAIAQNIWSFAGDSDVADVNVFSAQVSVNYKLKNRWYLTSAPLVTANWKVDRKDRWTVPLGGGIGRLFKLKGKKAVAIDIGAYYNVEVPRFANNWYSQVLVNFLFPK